MWSTVYRSLAVMRGLDHLRRRPLLFIGVLVAVAMLSTFSVDVARASTVEPSAPPASVEPSAPASPSVEPSAADNVPPVVDAGADQELPGPGEVTLTGSATDTDGPALLSVVWSATGPAGVGFATPGDVATTATLPEPGVYVLRLTADDGAAVVLDELVVTVLDPSPPADPADVAAAVRELGPSLDAVTWASGLVVLLLSAQLVYGFRR